MPSYNLETLKKYCTEKTVQLLKDYTNENVKRELKINGKCCYENCNNEFNKSFRAMVQIGAYCKECSVKNKIIKSKQTCLNKYGVENGMQTEQFKEKSKQTCLKKYGVSNPFQAEECKEKYKQTCLEKYGVEHLSKTEQNKQKIKKTCLEKYGVLNPFQVEEFKEKYKQTCLEKYGVSNPFQAEECKEKYKQTCLKKYGVDHNLKSYEIKEKVKQTCLEKYGHENTLQVKEFREKSKQTCLKKYGVEHGMQNKEIFDKSINNSYKLKTYSLPSGKEIKYQGYENYALDELIQNYEETDIITGVKNVPTIWYNDADGKKHRHYVDIFIPGENKCIEVKSTWTFKKKKDNVLEKQITAKEKGFNYEIWVYDKDGNKVEIYL